MSTERELKSELKDASTSFWRSAAFTAASVAAFTVSAIGLDMGVAAGSALLQVAAAVTAASSIGGAVFAQKASSKIDGIETEIEVVRAKEIERTTQIEYAPKEKRPVKEVSVHQAHTKHVDAATKEKDTQAPQIQR